MKTLQAHHLKIKQKRRRKIMFFSCFLGLLIIFSGIVYFFLFSEIFKIKNIEINQIKIIDLNIVKSGLENILKQGSVLGFLVVSDNILFMPSERINNFLKDFPAIESFSWKKNIFSRSLKVDIKERENIGILRQKEDKNYYFDKNGILFIEAPSSEGGMFLIIENELNYNFNLGNRILEMEPFNNLISIINFLNDNFQLHHIKLQLDKIEIVASLVNSHQILFYLETDNLNQIHSVLSYFVKNNFDFNLEYLDLRYLPNVYYK